MQNEALKLCPTVNDVVPSDSSWLQDASTKSEFWPYVINGIKSYKSDVFCYGEILNTAATSIMCRDLNICIPDSFLKVQGLQDARSRQIAFIIA